METKYVRVQFDVELAKEITNGTKEGRIVTRGGYSVKILCFDRKTDMYPIISLVDVKNQESFEFYGLNGRWSDDGDDDFDLVLEIPEYMTFKDGDVIAFGRENTYIGLFKSYFDCNKSHSDYVTLTHKNKLFFDDDDWTCNNERFATEEEKQKLIDALKQSEDPRAKECLKKMGIEEEPKCNFNPFDKVVVRENDSLDWEIDLFMKYEKEFETYRCMTGRWKQCLPFNEETEKLIGTTKSYNLN